MQYCINIRYKTIKFMERQKCFIPKSFKSNKDNGRVQESLQ